MTAQRFAFAVAPVAGMIQQRSVQNFDSSPTPSSFYKEFAAHFRDGDVPAGKIVEWRKSDGTTVISSQGDNFCYWPSGALRTYSVTVLHSGVIGAGSATTWKAYPVTGSWNTTGWATTSAITARDIRMEITIGGTTYTLSANNEVSRGTTITKTRSGPLSVSWKIWGEFRNGTGGSSTPQGTIWGIMYLTFFSDGTYSAWGDINSSRYSQASAPAYTVTDYKLKDYVGPTTLFDYSTSFTMYGLCRASCCNTVGLHPYTGTSVDKCVVGFPINVLADPTTSGLYDACIAWWYKSTPTMIANLVTGTTATYIPMSPGDYSNVDQTGGNPWIGPMTEFACQSMLVGDYTTLCAERINALDLGMMAGYCGDPVTGFPLNFTANTYTGLSASQINAAWGVGSVSVTLSGGFAPGFSASTEPRIGSHAPTYAWFMYVSTGQEWWLNHLFDQAFGWLGAYDRGNGFYARNAIINSHSYNAVYGMGLETRAYAWSLRTLGNTSWITPDAHVMKPYLADVLSGQFTFASDFITSPNTNASAATLGAFDGGDAPSVAEPWEHDYLATSYSMEIRRGTVTTSDGFVANHIVKWTYGRGVSGCMYGATPYRMGLGVGSGVWDGIHYATAWSDVWIGDTIPLSYALQAPNGNPSCPASGINNDVTVVGSNGYEVGHTYPVIFQVGAVAGQAAGISTAPTIVSYMATVESAAAITEASWGSFNTGAVWRIRPPA